MFRQIVTLLNGWNILFPVLILCFLFGALGSAVAQTQVVPPSVDPGQLERQFDQPRSFEDVPEINLPPPEQLIPGQIEEIRFRLSGVVLEQSTVYEARDIEELYESLIGSEVAVTAAYDLAASLTAKYRSDGYILSRVIVPPQRIEGGVLRLQAVEGFVDQVRIEGALKSSDSLLRHYMAKVQSSVPLRAADLERYVLLANDLPGIEARVLLSPSETTPAATDLTLVISEDRVDGFGTIDNYGSEFNGPYQGQFGLALNSLFGRHDRTQARVVGASEISELQFYELTHEQQIGRQGTRVVLGARHTRSRPGGSLEDLELDSQSTSADVTLIHPFLRSRADTLRARLTLSYRDSKTDIIDTPLSKDEVSVVRVGAGYEFVDRLNGINFLDVEFSQGVDLFGDSSADSIGLSRGDADLSFQKVNFQFARLQRVAPGFSLLANVAGQYSSDGLVASEEFSVGRTSLGRAFDPSEVSGDKGAAARLELRYDHSLPSTVIDGVQLYSFADYGAVWNRSPVTGSDIRENLSSAGAGLRVRFADSATINLEAVIPTVGSATSRGTRGDTARVLFGVNYQF